MNRSRPGLPVHHQLPEFTQAHVHRVGDAIQPGGRLKNTKFFFFSIYDMQAKSLYLYANIK